MLVNIKYINNIMITLLFVYFWLVLVPMIEVML